MFKPKIAETLRHYSKRQLLNDATAGVIVGIVAVPLAIAFAIASGVSPEKGIITGIIAGFIISAFGGSRVQIGGPTGAFIVIVYSIVAQHGVDGLIIATFMAGILLIIMGIAKLGIVIKFIPYPLIIGFTTGIALVIFSTQVKDFFGIHVEPAPSGFIDTWVAISRNIQSVNPYAVAISVSTLLFVLFWPKVTAKIPGSLVAIVITTFAAYLFRLPIDTIGSRFGTIPSAIPPPAIPHINFAVMQQLIEPAVTIALLGGIESLLSAVVADGMIRGNHRSNTELIAQGMANVATAIFGGIPATGAIARTATNVKNGGRTPVAGIVHALTLLVILLFIGQWVAYIPLAALAGILVVVAYNMSEWRHTVFILKGSRDDAAVLIITFILTVLVNITVAIQIGVITAAFLFIRKMLQASSVQQLTHTADDKNTNPPWVALPENVEIFEIHGPMFFGAAYKFRDAIKIIELPPKVLIIRMRNVPVIDATGIHVLKEIQSDMAQSGTKIVLTEVNSDQVMNELKKARLVFRIGKANIKQSLGDAIARSEEILAG